MFKYALIPASSILYLIAVGVSVWWLDPGLSVQSVMYTVWFGLLYTIIADVILCVVGFAAKVLSFPEKVKIPLYVALSITFVTVQFSPDVKLEFIVPILAMGSVALSKYKALRCAFS